MRPLLFSKLGFLFLLGGSTLHAQSFVNGDLEAPTGSVCSTYVTGPSIIPPSWTAIPITDPICRATTAVFTNTADLFCINASGFATMPPINMTLYTENQQRVKTITAYNK